MVEIPSAKLERIQVPVLAEPFTRPTFRNTYRNTRRNTHGHRPWASATALSLVLALAGCGSSRYESRNGPPPGPAGSATSSAPPRSSSGTASTSPTPGQPATGSPASALVPERKFLADWFNGTPVVINFDREGALCVEVPLQFAFEPGQSKPSAALVKVVDRVGASLRRVPTAKVHVSTPPDPAKPDVAMAERRAQAVREAVVGKGVNAIRIAGAGASSTVSGVQLRIVMP
jgi:outer membrane protein OmpA-like peptidoglycan-associated protein